MMEVGLGIMSLPYAQRSQDKPQKRVKSRADQNPHGTRGMCNRLNRRVGIRDEIKISGNRQNKQSNENR